MTTPVLTSVSGTISAGQTLAVVGTNMHNHNPTNLEDWFGADTDRVSFQGTSPSGDGYTDGSPRTGQTYTTTNGTFAIGAKSMQIVDSGASDEGSKGGNELYWFWGTTPSISGQMFHSALEQFTVTGGWPTDEHKHRWYSHLFQNWTLNGGNAPTQLRIINELNGAIPDWVSGNIPGGAIVNGDWYFIETIFDVHGSRTAGQYRYQVVVDHEVIINITNAQAGAVFTSGWAAIDTNWWGTSSGFSWTHRLADHRVSSTRQPMPSKFELGDNSGNWAYCRPITSGSSDPSISDTKLYVKVPSLTGLVGGATKARVTNNRGETSSEFSLTGGGGGSPSYRGRSMSLR